VAVTGRWQVELLPGARAGLMESSRITATMPSIRRSTTSWLSKKTPRRKTRNTFGRPETITASTSAVHFTVPYTACFSGSESCSSSASGREVQCI
jgi:hypothetical protein